MVQLIAFLIFLVSVLGITLILLRKAPVLAKLPSNGHHGIKKHPWIVKIENKIKQHHFHLFEKQMLLHRILSFFKIWTLRLETKIDVLLQKIRKKAQELDKEMRKKK